MNVGPLVQIFACSGRAIYLHRTCLIQCSLLSKMTKQPGPVEVTIAEKLGASLQPSHLDVTNESFMHNVPKGSETHFKVVVVSSNFENLSLIKRHRMVNDILKEELAGSVHALSIVAKTPSQWMTNSNIHKSPACLGGMAREKAGGPT
ncbi:BolA-like protein 1 [Holothuria leucospilota]|uniref:BolA-like protein 1 n=1 Tax=Holothuria leucospilota TaxID=206669 RepID=A0A9Q0YI25_HOLLE|nr:BolA-like protein 1 [Holothuria leucospilota]